MARIRHAAGRVDDLARHHPGNSPLHLYVRRLNAAFDPAAPQNSKDRKKLITQARDTFLAHIKRVEDLSAAALSAPDREHLAALIEKEGMKITDRFTISYRDQENIGTALCAAR